MAYNFNGTNQFLKATGAPLTATPATLACWFYPLNNTSRFTLVALRSEAEQATNNYFSLSARGDAAGDPVRVAVDGVNPGVASTTTPFLPNNWNHACGVFPSTSSRTVYLNAAGAGTNTTVNANPIAISRVMIGMLYEVSFPAPMNGYIAEVGIWNAALTTAEIASLAKGMTCDKVRPQSLVFYAPLIRDLQDTKGGLIITPVNDPTVATHPRIYK